MTRKLIILVFVSAASLVAVVGAIADPDDSSPPSQGSEQIASIEPAALAALAVLGEPRGDGDALPEELAERMNVRSPFGMNPDLSRIAIGNATSSVYVIPAAGRVCVSLTMDGGVGGSCSETHEVASGKAGPVTAGLGARGVAVYGLVPDGVESVSVQTRVGTSDLSTERNAYYTVLPAGTVPGTVRYTGPSGTVEFPIRDPVEVFED